MFPIEWFEISRSFIAIAFQLCFRVCHYEGSGKQGGLKLNGPKSATGLY
jgi:hypothetical protein